MNRTEVVEVLIKLTRQQMLDLYEGGMIHAGRLNERAWAGEHERANALRSAAMCLREMAWQEGDTAAGNAQGSPPLA